MKCGAPLQRAADELFAERTSVFSDTIVKRILLIFFG